MKAAFDRLTIKVRELALQDACVVGILEAERGEQTAILSALETVESKSRVDIVHTFAIPFDGANAWTLRTMLHLESMLKQRDEALATHGVAPRPLPPECRATTLSPLARWQLAIDHLIGDLEATGYLVLAILPTEVNAREEFAALLASLTPSVNASRVRVLLREHPNDYLIRNALDRTGTQYAVKCAGTTPRDLEEQLHRDVADDALPPIARAQALLQIGVLDFSHRRLDESRTRLTVAVALLRTLHAKELLPPALHALASTVSAQGGDATDLLSETVSRAREAQSWMVLSLASSELGLIRLKQGHLDVSEACFVETMHAARAVGNASLFARAAMHLGDIQSERGMHSPARDQWAHAANMAAQTSDHALAEEANRKLGELYEFARLPHEAKAHRCAEHEHADAFRCELREATKKLSRTAA